MAEDYADVVEKYLKNYYDGSNFFSHHRTAINRGKVTEIAYSAGDKMIRVNLKDKVVRYERGSQDSGGPNNWKVEESFADLPHDLQEIELPRDFADFSLKKSILRTASNED